jgi:hypothetical protein
MNHKLQRTTTYSQFVFTKENRAVDMLNLKTEHKKLRESMRQYGFLPAFPLMVKAHNGKFIVIDGQHRLTFAKELGLEVFFVVDDSDVNISQINQAHATWAPPDYAKRWAAAGNKDYIEALAFAEEYGIRVATAFAMLAGTSTFGNIKRAFHDGQFRIKARGYATRVASLYKDLGLVNSNLSKSIVLDALWSCSLIDDFDGDRLLKTAQRRPDLVARPGTLVHAYEVLEDLYNFGRQQKFPLAFKAKEAGRDRKTKFGRERPLPGSEAA